MSRFPGERDRWVDSEWTGSLEMLMGACEHLLESTLEEDAASLLMLDVSWYQRGDIEETSLYRGMM